MIITSN